MEEAMKETYVFNFSNGVFDVGGLIFHSGWWDYDTTCELICIDQFTEMLIKRWLAEHSDPDHHYSLDLKHLRPFDVWFNMGDIISPCPYNITLEQEVTEDMEDYGELPPDAIP